MNIFGLQFILLASHFLSTSAQYLVVKGLDGTSPSCGNNVETNYVRCCMDAAPCPLYWKTNGQSGVCTSSGLNVGGCFGLNSHADGSTVCSNLGARLCLDTEIAAGYTTGTGCNYDLRDVWTDSMCTLETASPTVSPTSVSPTFSPTMDTYCGDKDVKFDGGKSEIDDSTGDLNLYFYASYADFSKMQISSGSCSYDSDGSNGASGIWEVTDVYDLCQMFHITVPLNTALSSCGFDYDASDNEHTKVRSTFTIVTENTNLLTGELFTYTASRFVEAELHLATTINLASTAVSVYGSVTGDAQVYSLNFDDITEVLTLNILTAVQYPYKVNIPVVTELTGWAITSVEDGTLPSTMSCTANNTCFQMFTIVAEQNEKCSDSVGLLLELDRSWELISTLYCHSEYTGMCDIQAPNSEIFTYDTDSNNYCPIVVDVQQLTGSMAIYDENTRTNLQSKFVFGNTAYVGIIVNAFAELEQAWVEELRLVDDTRSLLVYTNADGSSADYLSYDSNAFSQLSVINDLPGATSNQKTMTSSFIWSDITSNSVGELPKNTIVQALVRVIYVNQTNSRRRMLEVATPSQQLLGEERQNEVRAFTEVSVVAAVPVVAVISMLAVAIIVSSSVAMCSFMGLLYCAYGRRRQQQKKVEQVFDSSSRAQTCAI